VTARAVAGDPLTEFLTFSRNTRWYAEHWLRRGSTHPREHWVISERLDPWRQRVSAAEASLREALLDELLTETVPMRAAPAPALTMPTGASAEPAGEQKPAPRHPSTGPRQECVEAVEATGKYPVSQKRAYHRRAVPRWTGRWAHKCHRRAS
jgi:hypothetical protein